MVTDVRSITDWEDVEGLLAGVETSTARIEWFRIRPYAKQPRKNFQGITALAGSIRSLTQLDSVKVRPLSDEERAEIAEKVAAGKAEESELEFTHELIDGERRLRSMRENATSDGYEGDGLIDCKVYHIDDELLQFIISIASNFGSQEHDPLEIADAFGRLRDEVGMNAAAIARFVGRSDGYVAGFLRLLDLAPELRKRIEEGTLGAAIGKVLARVVKEEQLALLEQVERGGHLNVGRVTTAVERKLEGDPEARNPNVRKRSRTSKNTVGRLATALTRAEASFGDMTPASIGFAVEDQMGLKSFDYGALVDTAVNAADSLIGAIAAVPSDGSGLFEELMSGVFHRGLKHVLDVDDDFWQSLEADARSKLIEKLEQIQALVSSAITSANSHQ